VQGRREQPRCTLRAVPRPRARTPRRASHAARRAPWTRAGRAAPRPRAATWTPWPRVGRGQDGAPRGEERGRAAPGARAHRAGRHGRASRAPAVHRRHAGRAPGRGLRGRDGRERASRGRVRARHAGRPGCGPRRGRRVGRGSALCRQQGRVGARAGVHRARARTPRTREAGRGGTREEKGAGLTAGRGSIGRTRRRWFWATRAMWIGERNVVGEKEMNRGRLRGLRAGPTCSGCRTASASAGRARRAHALAAGPRQVGPPRFRPKTQRGEKQAAGGNGDWATDAWPAHDEKGGKGRPRLGCAREAGPREVGGLGFFLFIFPVLALIHH
jgi:hypothetical protein